MTRVRIQNNQIKYDNSHDILHVLFYPEHLSIDDEEFPGIVIRRSINDDRITGITIMDFSKREIEFLQRMLPRYDFSELRRLH
jgi:hypothetical protein